MLLDERINSIEQPAHSSEANAQLETQASAEYTTPIETPDFKLPSELEGDPSVEQVEPTPQPSETAEAVEYEPKYTSENYGSKEKAHEALVLEALINHGVKEEDASEEMERVLGLAADLKE